MLGIKKSNSDTVKKTLDTTLFSWPGHSQDRWTIRDATMGTQIFGATGSGKSSGSGQKIAKAFLKNGFGGLVLCAKPGEREEWERYAKDPKINRHDDLVIFDKYSALQFNPLAYEMGRSGDGAGESLNLVDIVMVLHELGKSFMAGGQSSGDERFWDNALRRCIRNTLDLLKLANEELTFENMKRIISSALNAHQATLYNDKLDILKNPELDQEEKQSVKESLTALCDDKNKDYFCLKCLYAAYNTDDFNQEEKENYAEVLRYFTSNFANLNMRTRSIVEESFLGVLEPFSGGILKQFFSTDLDPEIMPEGTFNENKVVILDFPIKQYLLAGVYAQGIYKHIWQQAMERRKVSNEEATPVFLWGDEVQFFLTEYDALFATTARSSLVSIVFLSQNINNYYAAMKGNNTEAKTKSLLGNLSTKIYHANSDFETNDFASKAIGQTFVEQMDASKSAGQAVNARISEHLHFQLEPREFTILEQGGQASNGYRAEAIVTQTGRKWGNDKNYARVKFDQNE